MNTDSNMSFEYGHVGEYSEWITSRLTMLLFSCICSKSICKKERDPVFSSFADNLHRLNDALFRVEAIFNHHNDKYYQRHMGLGTAAMDYRNIIWIKAEATEDASTLSDSTLCAPAFDPQIIKEELCAPAFDPQIIKEELCVPEFDPQIIKEEELSYENDRLDDCDPLSVTNDEDTASKRTAADSPRFPNISSDTGSIAFEETRLEEATADTLNTAAEKSINFVVGGAPRQGCFSENTVGYTRSINSVQKNEVKDFTCSSCSQTFLSKYSLIMHVFIHIDGVPPPMYVCTTCGEVFLSSDRLAKHLAAHIGSSERECHQQSTYTGECGSLESGEVTCSDRKAPKPDFSNKSITTAVSLQPHNSDGCDKSISYYVKNKSISVTYPAERPYKCNVCEKEFTTVENIKNHVLRHTGEKSHKCDICGMAFTLPADLKRHAVIHSSVRPHKCKICGKSYADISYLDRHALTHTGKSPYKCEVCGRTFTVLGHLKTHFFTHTGKRPLKCDVCGKTFIQSGHLKSHSLLHTGVSAHKCEVCGKPFSALSNLKKHALTHTREKPHKCNVCGKSFTVFNTMKRHALIHV